MTTLLLIALKNRAVVTVSRQVEVEVAAVHGEVWRGVVGSRRSFVKVR